MYYNTAIPIPIIEGKIVLKTQGSSTYVLYEYDRVYDSKKQYNIPKRTIIGKIDTSNPLLMYPNDSFQEHFPLTALPEIRSEAIRSCCLRIGTYIVIRKIVEKLGLLPILEKRIGKHSALILDLATFCIVNEHNMKQHYSDFAFSHPLFSTQMCIYSDEKISSILSSITKTQITEFLNDWNKKRDQNQRVYISYDNATKSNQPGDFELIERGLSGTGNSSSGDFHNLALVFDQCNSKPLLYEEYPSSINNISRFNFIIDKVLEFKYKNICFVIDRGCLGKDNIHYLDDNNYNFIKVAGTKALVCDTVNSKRNTFETKRVCLIRPYMIYGITTKRKLYRDDNKERYFHIFFNSADLYKEREQLEEKIESYCQFINKSKGKPIKFNNSYTRFFNFFYDKDGQLIEAKEKEEVIQKQLDMSGYFCIITSEKMSAEEALILYKGRDSTDNLFNNKREFIGSANKRKLPKVPISAKFFIQYIALILRSEIYSLINNKIHPLDLEKHSISLSEAIKEFERIEMVIRGNGFYQLDHALTQKQQMILNAFDVDLNHIREAATEISNQLVN